MKIMARMMRRGETRERGPPGPNGDGQRLQGHVHSVSHGAGRRMDPGWITAGGRHEQNEVRLEICRPARPTIDPTSFRSDIG